MKNKEIKEYPNDSEICEFFENFIGLENSRDFFKCKGIFFITNKNSDLAKYGSKIVFGYDDFGTMKSVTSTKQNFSKISGFLIKADNSIEDLMTSFRTGEIIKEKNNLKITGVSKEGSDKIKLSYSFDRKTPGKMNLISAEERIGDFWIEKNSNGNNNLVLFNHSKNEDYGEIKDILSKVLKDTVDDFEIVPLTLRCFPVKKRIDFIDKVLQYDYKDWELEEVIKLRVKYSEEMDEEIEDVMEEEEDKLFLEGINDAILHGHNLRVNSFVVKCEKSGYYFPSVVMRMNHKSEPYKINLEVQFKFRPDMPEINILDSYIIEDDEEKVYSLNKDFKKQTLDGFFHDIVGIYDSLM